MSRIKHLKGDKIYFPMGTSKWVDNQPTNERLVLEVTITAGGGMGGSRWTRLIKPQQVKDGLNWYETIDGEEIAINTNYIVEVKKFYLYTVDYLCTNSNFGLNNSLEQVKVLVPLDVEPVLVSQYKGMDEWTY